MSEARSVSPVSVRTGPVPGAAADGPGPWATTAGLVLSLVAVAMVGFALVVVVVSPIEHARSQQVSYASFRADLANATAPTGQLDLEGRLLALGTPVAFLESEALGLDREIVGEGTTAAVLARGPGHRRNTVLPGQAGVSVVYGRAWSYGGPFGGLADVPLGTRLQVTTGQGRHEYEVAGVRREGSVLPPPPGEGEGRLTLVSATGPPYVPTDTVYVDARLLTDPVPAPSRVLGAASLLPSEEALATDEEAWVPVTLYLMAAAAVSLAAAWLSLRWGRRQVWLVVFPVQVLLAVLASREVVRLLPNLL